LLLAEANAAATTATTATAAQAVQDAFARVYFCGSGSEACEAALKLARQYFVEREGPATPRRRFISRWGSYHGTTLGALSVSGHWARRRVFEEVLLGERNVSFVAACNVYRGRREGESEVEFGLRLVRE